MKKKLFFLILLSVLCYYGCSYYYEKTEEYLCYYDKERTKIKMKGEKENENQNGEWKYFDINGSVVQHGTYQNGLLTNIQYN